jgi:hypothetical protein
LVFNMHLYELTKYSQESSPWMLKRDILCAIWSPNVCSLKGCGYFRAWTAWVIYLLTYTPLSGADEVSVVIASHYCSYLLQRCWQFWHFHEQLWLVQSLSYYLQNHCFRIFSTIS